MVSLLFRRRPFSSHARCRHLTPSSCGDDNEGPRVVLRCRLEVHRQLKVWEGSDWWKIPGFHESIHHHRRLNCYPSCDRQLLR